MLKSSMILGLQKLEESVSMSIEIIITIAVIVPCIIFFAKDFRLGAVMFLLMNGLLTALFIYLEWSYKISLILTFVGVILLCFSLYLLSASKQQGGFI